MFALAACSACSSSDGPGFPDRAPDFSPRRRQQKTPQELIDEGKLNPLKMGAYGWTCSYTYFPSKPEMRGNELKPCISMKDENMRHGVATTAADSERGALWNFHMYIWQDLRNRPERPEYMGMLIGVWCRRADGSDLQ